MVDASSIPASTVRMHLAHVRRRSFRWRFLLELVLLFVCCSLLLVFAVLALLTDSNVVPDDPIGDFVGWMWNEDHHVRVDCYDAAGSVIQSTEHLAETELERDEFERDALFAAFSRGLPLVQTAAGTELARWDAGWIAQHQTDSLEPLEVEGSTARWSQPPTLARRFLAAVGWRPLWTVSVRCSPTEILLETPEGPSRYDPSVVLSVRWGRMMHVGSNTWLGPNELHVVSRNTTERIRVPDARVGAALAAFLQRGIQEACTDSSSC